MRQQPEERLFYFEGTQVLNGALGWEPLALGPSSDAPWIDTWLNRSPASISPIPLQPGNAQLGVGIVKPKLAILQVWNWETVAASKNEVAAVGVWGTSDKDNLGLELKLVCAGIYGPIFPGACATFWIEDPVRYIGCFARGRSLTNATSQANGVTGTLVSTPEIGFTLEVYR